MSIKRRLSGLEKAAGEAAEPKPPWSPPEGYASLRREVQDEIARDLKIGEEPLFWIDGDGVICATDDDSFVRHLGDYIRAGDREIKWLEREITEAEATMTPEETRLAYAERKETLAALSKLSIDEGIAFLKAEIGELEAEIAREAEPQEVGG
jgi:hypothetical protein